MDALVSLSFIILFSTSFFKKNKKLREGGGRLRYCLYADIYSLAVMLTSINYDTDIHAESFTLSV